MNECKGCEWYGKPYWSVINPCDSCPREETNVETLTRWQDPIIQDPIIEEQKKEIERLNNIIDELEKMVNNFDVFKEFTFPLMKRDVEQQIKSSIDYEWRNSIKKPFLDKLQELKGDDKE